MTTKKHDSATYSLPSREAAWEFMRAVDAAGGMAGFPSLRAAEGQPAASRTVQVAIRTCHEREAFDALANGAPVIEYRFA